MNYMQRFLLSLCLLMLCGGSSLFAQANIPTRNLVTGLNTPWEILWGPDNWIWMTERYGRVSRINPETGEVRPLLMVPDAIEEGEIGLLGMALHPNFQDSAHVFLMYGYRYSATDLGLRVTRYTYNGSTLIDPKILLDGMGPVLYQVHGGSRLRVTPDRKLIVTLGDFGDMNQAQSRTSFAGKILRMNLDGTAPADNPWSSGPFPENLFWTMGHRNVQGLAVGPNGTFYISEHGEHTDDELNIIQPGGNYGWPEVEGKCDKPSELPYCTSWNVVESIAEWTPTLAVAGIEYYNHEEIPGWKNSIIMTTLKESELRVLRLNAAGTAVDSQMVYFDRKFGRLRDVCIAPSGHVYLAVSNRDGYGIPMPGDDRIIEVGSRTSPWLNRVIPGRTSYSAGDTALVAFEAEGSYPAGNIFIAQLSDSSGSFGSPKEIGRVVSFDTVSGQGRIMGKIPCDIEPGGRYQIRVISTNPGLMRIHENQITVEARPPVAVAPGSPVSFCAGDSATLAARPGYRSYRWSTGDTTRTITVRDSGTYFVTVTDESDCPLTSSDLVVVVHPIPVPAATYSANILDAGADYASYQWELNGSAIAGATGRTHVPTVSGSYSVIVRTAEGCKGISPAVAVTLQGTSVDREENGEYALRLSPQPARETLIVTFTSERRGKVTISVIDLKGVEVIKVSDWKGGVSYTGNISLRDLPSGAYLLRVSDGAGERRGKFVKE